jgi:hypothetical protein
MISLMRDIQRCQHEGVTSRRDLLAAGITGAAVLVARPLTVVAEAADPDRQLRQILQTYGGEFGPAQRGVNHGRL